MRNAAALNLAIAAESGDASLFIPDEKDCNKAKCSMVSSRERGINNEIAIKASRVRDLEALQHLTRCDVNKNDLEGYESVVIKELLDIINAFLPVVIFEYDTLTWAPAGASLPEVCGLLEHYLFFDLARGIPLAPQGAPNGDILCLPR